MFGQINSLCVLSETTQYLRKSSVNSGGSIVYRSVKIPYQIFVVFRKFFHNLRYTDVNSTRMLALIVFTAEIT